METSLTDIKKQYEKLKAIIGDKNRFDLSYEDAYRCQDALKLLKERSYIFDASSLSTASYLKTAEWDGFEDWLDEMITESKRLSRREWAIALVGAVAGAVLSAIATYIVTVISTAG
mgnify:CR=1 FL=1